MTKTKMTREQMLDELTDFISEYRRANPFIWFIGIPQLNGSPDMISTSLRGYFVENYWQPIDDERAECCDEVPVDSTNAMYLAEHCASKEHVRRILERRDDEALEREYQYMLASIAQILEGAVSE